MKHEDYREMISFYIDDLLGENEKREFEAHIEECLECRKELEEMKQVINELSEMDELDLPDGFEKELESKLLNAKLEMSGFAEIGAVTSSVKKKSSKFKWKYIYSTAAALMLVVAGTAYFNSELNFVGRAAKDAAPVARSVTGSPAPAVAAFDATISSGEGASAKMLTPTESLPLGGANNNEKVMDMAGANNGNTTKNKNIVGAGTNSKTGGSGKNNQGNNEQGKLDRSLAPTLKNTVTPVVTPGNDMLYTMTKMENKELRTGNIKVNGDQGKYQPWADKVIIDGGGALISRTESDGDQRFEYELLLDNFWTVYDSLTELDGVKKEIGVSGVELLKTDEALDKSEEYDALKRAAAENSTAGADASAKLKVLENALLKAKIVIVIHN